MAKAMYGCNALPYIHKYLTFRLLASEKTREKFRRIKVRVAHDVGGWEICSSEMSEGGKGGRKLISRELLILVLAYFHGILQSYSPVQENSQLMRTKDTIHLQSSHRRSPGIPTFYSVQAKHLDFGVFWLLINCDNGFDWGGTSQVLALRTKSSRTSPLLVLWLLTNGIVHAIALSIDQVG